MTEMPQWEEPTVPPRSCPPPASLFVVGYDGGIKAPRLVAFLRAVYACGSAHDGDMLPAQLHHRDRLLHAGLLSRTLHGEHRLTVQGEHFLRSLPDADGKVEFRWKQPYAGKEQPPEAV